MGSFRGHVNLRPRPLTGRITHWYAARERANPKRPAAPTVMPAATSPSRGQRLRPSPALSGLERFVARS